MASAILAKETKRRRASTIRREFRIETMQDAERQRLETYYRGKRGLREIEPTIPNQSAPPGFLRGLMSPGPGPDWELDYRRQEQMRDQACPRRRINRR